MQYTVKDRGSVILSGTLPDWRTWERIERSLEARLCPWQYGSYARLVRIHRTDNGCAYNAPGEFAVTFGDLPLTVTLEA
jgi:hypothetical protein